MEGTRREGDGEFGCTPGGVDSARASRGHKGTQPERQPWRGQKEEEVRGEGEKVAEGKIEKPLLTGSVDA